MRSKPQLLKLCNVAALVLPQVLNSVLPADNQRSLSEAYDHIANPGGPAFLIWPVIFLWETIFLVSQFLIYDYDDIMPKLTPAYCTTQFLQALWLQLFNRTDPSKIDKGGDFWIYSSTVVLIAIPLAFFPAVRALSDMSGRAYWLSLGITVNAAWVVLAAGLSVNMSALALGLRGGDLELLSIAVLVVTIVIELWITGFIPIFKVQLNNLAFLPVAIWALGWIVHHLNGGWNILDLATVSAEGNSHVERILPLYSSNYIMFYKWTALVLVFIFIALEIRLCKKSQSQNASISQVALTVRAS